MLWNIELHVKNPNIMIISKYAHIMMTSKSQRFTAIPHLCRIDCLDDIVRRFDYIDTKLIKFQVKIRERLGTVAAVTSHGNQWLSVRCNMSKTSARVSPGVPDTEKQMKARGRRASAFIVSRCLEPLVKHEARVFDMTSQTSVRI